VYDGCDAFGIQIDRLLREERTEEKLGAIYKAMGNRPIYITNYRKGQSELSDEQLAEDLLTYLSWGATLADVMGDYFCPSKDEITYDEVAVAKQKELIDRIHAMGKEVLMSSHTHRFMTAEEVLELAKAHQARGADISKIVAKGNTEAEEMENLRITTLLKKELDIPFLFLSGGPHCKIHRTIGPMLGCNMWLTTQKHDEHSVGAQPVCRAIRTIADNFNYDI
jgi:3-dehydroquinate dehydratase